MIVPAQLCHGEHCFLVVDTGASLVTVTPELVVAMGLTECTGEVLEVSLPGGLRTKGPRLTIPSVLVEGLVASEVEAVVLDAPCAGVDGLLGMSYLNRFEIALSEGRPRRLRLRPKGTPAQETTAGNTLVVVHEAADRWWADIVADSLTVMGYRLRRVLAATESGHESWAGAQCIVVVVASERAAASSRIAAACAAFAKRVDSRLEEAPIICALGQNLEAHTLPGFLSYLATVDLRSEAWRDLLGSQLRVRLGPGGAERYLETTEAIQGLTTPT